MKDIKKSGMCNQHQAVKRGERKEKKLRKYPLLSGAVAYRCTKAKTKSQPNPDRAAEFIQDFKFK